MNQHIIPCFIKLKGSDAIASDYRLCALCAISESRLRLVNDRVAFPVTMAKPEVTNLHILGFLGDRSSDLVKLDELLILRGSCGEGAQEQTRKSLKRKLASISTKKRTSSYIRYKLPRTRHNKKNKRPSNDAFKCRRERRNRAVLKKIHCIHDHEAADELASQLQSKEVVPRWLETHFWHKKRFLTQLRWGYCLPIHHKARGMKFLHDAVQTSAIIHDCSYIRPIQIVGLPSSIQDLLRYFTVSQ